MTGWFVHHVPMGVAEASLSLRIASALSGFAAYFLGRRRIIVSIAGAEARCAAFDSDS
ncbi:MAG: hypothetical protein INR68_18905 [Methylobacterium mesophilicum]|nr:hypothetical protein [Methylobacterium mesophilicum]